MEESQKKIGIGTSANPKWFWTKINMYHPAPASFVLPQKAPSNKTYYIYIYNFSELKGALLRKDSRDPKPATWAHMWLVEVAENQNKRE